MLLIAAFLIGLSSSQSFAYNYHHSEVAAPSNLDPIQASTDYANRVVTAVYDTLYEYQYLTRPYAIKPNLATGKPEISKDGLSYTIKIKQGVKFANDPCFKDGKGREVTSDDVAYSINRHFDSKNNSQTGWLFGQIKEIKTPERYTVVFELKKPNPQLIYTLAHGASAIVPKEAVEKYGIEFGRHPVGSGPWVLESFNKAEIDLVKNPDYRKEIFDIHEHGYDEKLHGFTGVKKLHGSKIPVVDKITIKSAPQDSARWLSFTKQDEIQYTVLSPEQTGNVLKTKNPISLNKEFESKYHVLPISGASTVYFEFNMADPNFGYHPNPVQNQKNKALRCAIRKGFNWDRNIEKRYHGIGQAFEGIVPPGIEGHGVLTPSDSTKIDVAGARKLLKDNGWNAKNLPPLEYTSTAAMIRIQMFEQFRAWMQAIGYPKNKVTHKKYTHFSDYWKDIKQSKLSFHGLAWSLDYPDAENIFQIYYGPNAAPGANNANYKNPEYDKVFEQASVMQPGPERTKLYQKLNQILVDDCVNISGFARTQIHMWHKNVIMYPAPQVIGNIFKWVGIEKHKLAENQKG